MGDRAFAWPHCQWLPTHHHGDCAPRGGGRGGREAARPAPATSKQPRGGLWWPRVVEHQDPRGDSERSARQTALVATHGSTLAADGHREPAVPGTAVQRRTIRRPAGFAPSGARGGRSERLAGLIEMFDGYCAAPKSIFWSWSFMGLHRPVVTQRSRPCGV